MKEKQPENFFRKRGAVWEFRGSALGNVVDVAVLVVARRLFAWIFSGTDVVNCDFTRGISGSLVGIYGVRSLALSLDRKSVV